MYLLLYCTVPIDVQVQVPVLYRKEKSFPRLDKKGGFCGAMKEGSVRPGGFLPLPLPRAFDLQSTTARDRQARTR